MEERRQGTAEMREQLNCVEEKFNDTLRNHAMILQQLQEMVRRREVMHDENQAILKEHCALLKGPGGLLETHRFFRRVAMLLLWASTVIGSTFLILSVTEWYHTWARYPEAPSRSLR